MVGSRGGAVTAKPFENLPEITRDIARLHNCSDVIVVCGGDGSISSAAPAVMESGLPFGIIPAGTANDLARTLCIPPDFEAAADLVVAGQTKRIDVGMVNGQPKNRHQQGIRHVRAGQGAEAAALIASGVLYSLWKTRGAEEPNWTATS